MKKYYAIIALLLATISSAFAQFSADADGALNVSPRNFSYTYTYPISNNAIDGYPISTTLTYAPNVVYAHFAPLFDKNGYRTGWASVKRTAPAWIISVNGFAVDVLNQKTDFVRTLLDDSGTERMDDTVKAGTDNYYTLKWNIWDIEGYDYCNNMTTHLMQLCCGYHDIDTLKLLRSDGSVLELRNSEGARYDGRYYECGVNTSGYAIVEFDETYSSANFANVKSRKLRYYAGDGLEYVFLEHVAPYGARMYCKPFSPESNSMSVPTIFYLQQINSSVRKLTEFKRKWHNFDNSVEDYSRGHPHIESFADQKYVYSKNSLNITTLDRTIKINLEPMLLLMDWDRAGFTEEQLDNYANNGPYQKKFDSQTDITAPYNVRNVLNDGGINYDIQFMVKDIIDPMNRTTSFTYDYGVERCGSWECSGWLNDLKNLKHLDEGDNDKITVLKTISEPTQYYSLTNDFSTHVLDPSFLQILRKVIRYEKKDGIIGDIIQANIYDIDGGSNFLNSKYSSLNYVYYGNVDTASISSYLNYHQLFQTDFKEYSSRIAPNDTCSELFPVRTTKYYLKDNVLRSEDEVTEYDTLTPGWVLPTKSYGHKNAQNISDNILTYYNEYTYEFGNIADNVSAVSYDTSLVNPYEKKIVTKTTKYYNPLEVSGSRTLLFTEKENFLNLPLIELSSAFSRLETSLNRQGTYINKVLNNSAVVPVFSSAINTKVTAPPIYGISQSDSLWDANDVLVGGKVYHYNTNFALTPISTGRRGALLSDTSFGRDLTPVNNSYTYRSGSYRNLLNSTTNLYGAKSKTYYFYDDLPSGVSPIGKRLTNQNNITEKTLYNYQPFCETPLSSETYVRKVNGDGVIYYDTLRTFNERNSYGQISAIVDNNGWYAEKQFDFNGREIYNWLPYDFPENQIDFANNEAFQQITDISQVFESCTLPPIISGGSTTTTTDLTQTCSASTIISNVNSPILGTAYTESAGLLDKNALRLVIPINSNSLLYGYTSADNTYFLNLTFSNYKASDNIGITVYSSVIANKLMDNEIGTYILGTDGVSTSSNLDNYCSLKIPLNDLTVNNSGNLYFYIVPTSANSKLILNTLSDDLGASISKKFTTEPANLDFTKKYIYDDSKLISQSFSKIDDPTHTNNINPTHGLEGYGRYAKAIDYFTGAGHKSSEFWDSQQFIKAESSDVAYSKNFVYSSHFDINENKISSLSNQNGEFLKKVFVPAVGDSIILGETLVNEFINVSSIPAEAADMDYFGYAKHVKTNNEQFISEAYYDAMGNLRYQIKDPDNLHLATKYNYDVYGNLNWIQTPAGDHIRYWYYLNGLLRYSYQNDVGFSSFKYDKLGRVRFSQTQLQADNDRVSFFEYDDLGRTTATGEAHIVSEGMPLEKLNFDEEGNLRSNENCRITDLLDPEKINYTFANNNGILTLNITLFAKDDNINPSYNYGRDLAEISATFPFPQGAHWQNITGKFYPFPTNYKIPAGPFFKQECSQGYLQDFVASNTADFENFTTYPQNLKTAVIYDSIPDVLYGPIWKNAPSKSQISTIAGGLTNLKGRQAAVAYRDTYDEELRYAFFSYDARGRVISLVRYSKTFGFDAVYYTYNSANKAIKVRTADPLRQRVVWYDFDDAGRVSNVYSAVSDTGFGFGRKNAYFVYPEDVLAKPAESDAVYSYTNKNALDNIYFNSIAVTEKFDYSPMGWTKKISAINDAEGVLYSQEIARLDNGLIENEIYRGSQCGEFSNKYIYDGISRVHSWVRQGGALNNAKKEDISFDNLGNLLSFARNGVAVAYNYNPEKPNQLTDFSNKEKSYSFEYYSNGAASAIEKTIQENERYFKRDEFTYTAGGMVKTLKSFWNNESGLDTTVITRYRYNWQGQRESKWQDTVLKTERVLDPLTHLFLMTEVSQNEIKDGVHYQLGAGGECLTEYYGRHVDAFTYYYAAIMNVEGGMIQHYADDGRTEYAIRDHLGSARFIIAQSAAGVITYKNLDYDPYGEKLGATSDKEREDGYGGNTYDGEMDYTAMGARWYLPEIGRFISPDPLWAAFPNMSPYVYANNNPLSFKDPSGMAPEKEKAKGNGNKTLETQPPLVGLSTIYNPSSGFNYLLDVDGSCMMAKFFAEFEYYSAQRLAEYRLGYVGGFSDFGAVTGGGGGIDCEFGGSDICALSDQGGGKTLSNGQVKFTATMPEGKKWSELSTGQKISLISQGLAYIQAKTAQTNTEWGFTISVEGNQVIMSNFVQGYKDRNGYDCVALDFNVPSSMTIVGCAHSHTCERVQDLNAHDDGFSNKDIYTLAQSYIGIRNIDMNCFTAFEIKGSRIETETIIDNNRFQDYVIRNRVFLNSNPNNSFDYDPRGNLKSNLEHCKAGVWYEKP